MKQLLTHWLCLYRSDRDQYIEIVKKNVRKGKLYLIKKKTTLSESLESLDFSALQEN